LTDRRIKLVHGYGYNSDERQLALAAIDMKSLRRLRKSRTSPAMSREHPAGCMAAQREMQKDRSMTNRKQSMHKNPGGKRVHKRTAPSPLLISDVIAGRRVEQIPIDQLRRYAAQPRVHSKKQLNLIAWSLERFGFINPVLIDHDNVVIAGHGRIMAALKLGLSTVPALRIEHLNAAAKRVYTLADNRLVELAGWNRESLMIELEALIDIYKNA
jgi:ParB-like nuclease domain